MTCDPQVRMYLITRKSSHFLVDEIISLSVYVPSQDKEITTEVHLQPGNSRL
jgi:hypothetical protein